MKILHILSSVDGGAGVAAYRLHQSLRKIPGVESKMLQRMDPKPTNLEEDIFTEYESENIFYRLKRKLGITPEKKNPLLIPIFPRYYEYEIASFPTSSYRIEDHPLVKEADIIHLHWISNFVNYPEFFKKVKKPIVWTLHDKNPFQGVFHFQTDVNNNPKYKDVEETVKQQKRDAIYQNKNINFVFPCNWLLNCSDQELFALDYPKQCIPYIINIPEIKHEKYNIDFDKNKKTILFIAHSALTKRKGFKYLQDALSLLDKDKKFNLITIGENNLSGNQLEHIHFERITDRNFINYIYSISDAVILSSIEDNLPNVMLEAFACGTPVISFSNGGMAEHITTGENGILIDKVDAEALKNGIQDLLEDKYTFDRDKIKQYAKDHFSEESVVKQYTELYKKLLS